MIIIRHHLSKRSFYLHYMSFFNEPYLRVLTPRTTNGMYPKMGPDGRQEMKETHLPLSARPMLEGHNRKLPDALKKKIEVVNPVPAFNGYQTIQEPAPVQDELLAKIAELEAQNAALLATQKTVEPNLFENDKEPVKANKPRPTQVQS